MKSFIISNLCIHSHLIIYDTRVLQIFSERSSKHEFRAHFSIMGNSITGKVDAKLVQFPPLNGADCASLAEVSKFNIA